MSEAFDDALVEGWEPLVDALELPDPNDRHVLAAAIRGRADVIVTENTKDFPESVLAPLGLAAIRLDDFLLDQFDLGPDSTRRVIAEQAAAKSRPPQTIETLLSQIAGAGAPRFAEDVAASFPAE